MTSIVCIAVTDCHRWYPLEPSMVHQKSTKPLDSRWVLAQLWHTILLSLHNAFPETKLFSGNKTCLTRYYAFLLARKSVIDAWGIRGSWQGSSNATPLDPTSSSAGEGRQQLSRLLFFCFSSGGHRIHITSAEPRMSINILDKSVKFRDWYGSLIDEIYWRCMWTKWAALSTRSFEQKL